MHSSRFLVLAILAIPCSPGFESAAVAQEIPSNREFAHLSLEDGLSQASVYCVHQDRRGFLWFGTADGLNRYDGYDFIIYRRKPHDSTSLSDNTISAICEDSLGNLWVGTMAQGLNRLDPRRGRFTRFLPGRSGGRGLQDGRVRSLATDRFGRVWIGTQSGGLHMVDPETGEVTAYVHNADDPHSLPHNTVRAVLPDNDGLWIGSDGGGLARLPWSDGEAVTGRFLGPQDLGLPPRVLRRIEKLFMDRHGGLWVGTVDEGAVRLRVESDGGLTIHRIPSRRSDPATLTGDIVQAFCEDASGAMWIGTWEGLNRLVPDSTQTAGYAVRRFTHDPANPGSISSSVVHALLVDRSGVMWIGTRSGGLSRFATGERKFRLYRHDPRRLGTIPEGSVRAITTDSRGFWVGSTGGGLAWFRESEKRVEYFRQKPGDPESLSSNDVRTLVFDHLGVLWVGTYGGGLNRLSVSERGVRIQRFETPVPKDDEVFAFVQDHRGRYWVGTQNGVVRFAEVDPSGRRPLTVTHFSHSGPEKTRISHPIARLLFEDNRGAVWIGTYGGLNRVDPEGDSVLTFLPDPADPFAISSKVVVAAWQDDDGLLWFGTFGGGLNCYDYTTNSFTVIDEADGLPNAYVYGILGDQDGSLWLSSNRGITRFRRPLWHHHMRPDSIALLFRTYDVRDGLQSNEFNAGASHRSPAGDLFFGGIGGMNRFRPEAVRDAKFAPPVAVTGFNIFERPVNLDSALASAGELVLAFNQNHFSFELAVLDYTNPAKNRYQYKLDGLDEGWVQAGNRRYVAYTNIGHGTYMFRVRGTNSDGVWSHHEASVPLRIEPPFWHEWWFRVSGLLVLGGIAGVVVVSRRRAAQREQTARERFLRQLIESQESERKRIAGELHDSLGQNLLIIKNKALMGIGSGGGEASVLDDISSLAGQTIREVREISYGLRPYQLDRLGLTKAIQAVCRQVQEAARIQVETSIESIDGLLAKDLEINLYRIVQESLNNAVKHAAATRITVTIKSSDARLVVEIADNGSGFAQDPAESLSQGGFGLSSIRERARILGGQASVHANHGEGARVVVTLPLPGVQG